MDGVLKKIVDKLDEIQKALNDLEIQTYANIINKNGSIKGEIVFNQC